ncbi:MarR family winged helix-turn-helix transcriptional regulator [Tianweitania populi]|uniref:MarR family winged helix-turn-helix transcriptional regulator n=1 Tax=Tianweitania populi TaxID=1607949 RepID=UPI00167B55DC|nr:MarR family transcriptional regulator [Tianweitania populi]
MTADQTERDHWLDGETKIADAPDKHGDETHLWLRLLTCTTLIETEIRRGLREEFDFTLPRFDLLAQLERAENGMVLGEISKRMMVSAGNLTALVERLVESGHITRTTSPSDRRVQIVTLTPFGHSAFGEMAERHRAWLNNLFSGVSAEERDVLLAALAKLKISVRQGLAQER